MDFICPPFVSLPGVHPCNQIYILSQGHDLQHAHLRLRQACHWCLECRQQLYTGVSIKNGAIDMARYTSIAELEALVAVFGLHGARLLAASLEVPLKVSILITEIIWQ